MQAFVRASSGMVCEQAEGIILAQPLFFGGCSLHRRGARSLRDHGQFCIISVSFSAFRRFGDRGFGDSRYHDSPLRFARPRSADSAIPAGNVAALASSFERTLTWRLARDHMGELRGNFVPINFRGVIAAPCWPGRWLRRRPSSGRMNRRTGLGALTAAT
jgi:hypothetical protein